MKKVIDERYMLLYIAPMPTAWSVLLPVEYIFLYIKMMLNASYLKERI